MICNNFPLTVLRFERSSLSPEFPGAVPSLNLLEALLVFREYLISLFNSKAASGVPLIIFIALMVSPAAN